MQYVKDNNTWKPTIEGQYVKDAGSWKKVKTAFIKDNDGWKKYYSVTNELLAGAALTATDSTNGIAYAFSGITIPASSYTGNKVRTVIITAFCKRGDNDRYPTSCDFKLSTDSVFTTAFADVVSYVNNSGSLAVAIFSVNIAGSLTSQTCDITINTNADVNGMAIHVAVIEGADYLTNLSSKNPYLAQTFTDSTTLNKDLGGITIGGTIQTYTDGYVIAAVHKTDTNETFTWSGATELFEANFADGNNTSRVSIAIYKPTTSEAARSLTVTTIEAGGKMAIAAASYR